MFDLVQREERMRNGGIPEQRGQTTDYRAMQLSDRMKNLCMNKFALLWGEAQLCLPYVCLWKKIAYSYPNVNYDP